MNARPPSNAQRGVALIALLVMLMLAGGYAFYRSANLNNGQIQERDTVLQRLVQAKDAVIAYAVNDTTRPGRLLCPDLIGDGNSPKFTQDDCASYGGWLPWSTLNLPESTDAQGMRFRYILSPAFGGKSVNKLLNSDTATSLRLDVPAGSASNDIAAIIIATRGPLDAANADGDDYFQNGAPDDPDNNDIVVAITRQELMAAVEQRIVNELRSCLEQHASSAENVQQTYPWPAPLSNTIFKGVENSLFGMVPDTQAGNPELALKNSITKLSILKNALNFPLTVDNAATQSANLTQLQQVAAYARVLFDRLYTVALALNISALQAASSFNTLDDTLTKATQNKAVFVAAADTLPGAITTTMPTLTNLQDALANSGFDLFLTELQAQNATLSSAIEIANAAPTVNTLNTVLTTVNEFKNRLLNFASTPNPDIEARIVAALNASSSAAALLNTAKKTLDQQSVDLAIAAARTLYISNQNLASTILAIKDIAYRADAITTLQATLLASDTATNRMQLSASLTMARPMVGSLNSGTTVMATARDITLTAIDAAISTANNVESRLTDIQTTATQAAIALNSLSEVLNDNVAIESLMTDAASLSNATLQAPKTVTAGKALRSPVQSVIYWSNLAASQSDAIATQARRGIINGVPTKEDSDLSAYTGARKLLDSLDGDAGSITLLDKYIKTGGTDSAAQAQAALNNTQSLLANLLLTASKLDNALAATMAKAATPTVWYGNACTFLKPPTGSATWWSANGWKNLVFYQISDRIRPSTGQLNVNGSGNYRAVAIAAGKALASQNRATRSVGNYLEGKNADNSRNGDAQSPSRQFSVDVVSPTFNDHLAY